MLRFLVDDGNSDGLAYEVRIYPHRRAYLRACHRFSPDAPDGFHSSSHATCFHRRIEMIDREGKTIAVSPIRGRIYLHHEMLDGEVVTHEATHAALNLFRTRHRGSGNLGRNLTPEGAEVEEEFAYSVGRIAQSMANEIGARQLWTRPD